MKTTWRTLWLGAGGLGLLALGVGVFLWLGTPRTIPPELPDIPPTNLSTSPVPTPAATVSRSPPTELVVPRLDPVDYPPGSVGHACEVNEFPPRAGYWFLEPEQRLRRGEKNPLLALRNEECKSALERHIYATNPYRWLDAKNNRQFAFIVTDNPLTFERLFTDPVGDLLRVQEALARPECHPGDDPKSNWKLNETCHADALLNYALITRFCYNEGVSNRTRKMYWEENNPTPAQDRQMWIQDLEDDWVKEKCESLDPTLNLLSEVHTKLRAQLRALYPDSPMLDLEGILIELAARLGDDAAALTRPVITSDRIYLGEGYKYGPLAEWFTDLFIPAQLFTKHPPSVDRLRELVLLFAENIGASGGKLIKFDHEALVQHLCTPPYKGKTDTDPASCRTVVNELRLQVANNPIMLEVIATFEDVAKRLDVYE
ncbi:MAG: hypothetical protein OXH84_01085 [Gammaproteobacteria bacterium]|nr:hypothetical protein [Gammaproteobacteria bacterium]